MTESKAPKEQLVNRRDIASVIGTALGAFALAGCTQSARAETESSGTTAEALTGTNFAWADTIADLKSLFVAATGSPQVVVLGGYHTPNDGGGGVFYAENGVTSGNDDGTIIVPTAAGNTGRWRRLFIWRDRHSLVWGER